MIGFGTIKITRTIRITGTIKLPIDFKYKSNCFFLNSVKQFFREMMTVTMNFNMKMTARSQATKGQFCDGTISQNKCHKKVKYNFCGKFHNCCTYDATLHYTTLLSCTLHATINFICVIQDYEVVD